MSDIRSEIRWVVHHFSYVKDLRGDSGQSPDKVLCGAALIERMVRVSRESSRTERKY